MGWVLRATLLILTVSGISCCSVIQAPQQDDPASATPAVEHCVQWFAKLDAAVDRAGVRDAGAHRIPGFPYLRADRFLGSFRNTVKDNPSEFASWVDRLRKLDATARAYEVRNLPASSLAALGVASVRAAAARTGTCAAELSRVELATPEQRERLIKGAGVPDEYIERSRILGLYPLATLPLSVGVRRWQDATVAMFRREAAGDDRGHHFVRYEPSGYPLGAARLRAIFAQARTDPLGIPQLSSTDREKLLETFAPIFEIDTTGAYDRFGPLAWGTGSAPEVDIAHPVVYRRVSYTRYAGHVLVQLVYTIWFPQRPPEAALDLLSGRLDGLIFRVTLDP
ncbi:MAG: hypothetical protein J2P48_01975, partial [Alphaproteobacteria bacterium]|nr:hypothetical protein [Alphaproteobacteria bacterium]